MEEAKARYITLLAIAAGTVLVLVSHAPDIFSDAWEIPLFIQGTQVPVETIMFLLVVFSIGGIVMLSAFFKWALYLFIPLEIFLLGIAMDARGDTAFLFVVIFLSLFVYVNVRLKQAIDKKKRGHSIS